MPRVDTINRRMPYCCFFYFKIKIEHKLNSVIVMCLIKNKLAFLSITLCGYFCLFNAFPMGHFNLIMIWTKFCSAWSEFSFNLVGTGYWLVVENMNIFLRVPAANYIITRIIQDNQQTGTLHHPYVLKADLILFSSVLWGISVKTN